MDQYKIHNKIAQGLLAVVYKVSRIDDKNNTPLILKEIECQDVRTAKSAQNEYRMFHSLNHRFICQLQDSFVKWDKKLSSAFICYIMDYYEKKDLMTYLNEMRNKKEIIPISLIENWIAYMVEGVNYLHENKVVHRNLKPSSFYFKTVKINNKEENQLLIGDYGVLSVMKDAQTKTRIISNPFHYAAPEIIDGQPFDYKSDLWGIGTTLLDICSTSLYDHKTFQSHLLNIRFDEELLNDILNDIQHVYESKSLIKLIKSLLSKDPEKRPTIKAIIHNDFVQDCLEKIDSNLIIHFDLTDVDYSNKLPKEKSLDKLIDYLIQNFKNESIVQACITAINQLINKQDFKLMNEKNQLLLLNIMNNYSHNYKIQLAVFEILENSFNIISKENYVENSEKFNSELKLINSDFITRFFYVFLKHERSREIQLCSLKIMIHLSNFENISKQLAEFDVIKYLLQVYNNFKTDPLIVGFVCKTIWNLSIHDSIIRTLSNKKCLSYVKESLINHQKNFFCVEMATNLLISLCADEKLVVEEEIETDVTNALLVSLRHHLDSASFVKSACIALSSLISFLEECAFRFIYLSTNESSESELDGISLLKIAYNLHKDRSEIVENICYVFKELSCYDEMVTEMRSIKLNENFINEITRRYRDNSAIYQSCFFVNSKIDEQIKADLIFSS